MIKQQTPNLMGNICLQSFIYDRIEDPLATLSAFFDYRSLAEHLEFLKHWKRLVETHNYAEISTHSNPLYDHKMIANLLNATFILYESDRGGAFGCRTANAYDVFEDAERLNAAIDLQYLDVSMVIDPFLALDSVFEYFTLQQYHEYLYDWLDTSLSPNVKLDDVDLIQTVYRNLQMLLEAAWLLCGKANPVVPILKQPKVVQLEDCPVGNSGDQIPAHLLSAFKNFLDLVPADRLNRGLRKMLMDYLFYNQCGLPHDFEELLTDLYWLTDLLDEINGKTVEERFV